MVNYLKYVFKNKKIYYTELNLVVFYNLYLLCTLKIYLAFVASGAATS